MKHSASGLASMYYDGKQAQVIPFLTLTYVPEKILIKQLTSSARNVQY